MNSELTPSAHPARALPAQPNLEHLKNEAGQRLQRHCGCKNPTAQLTEIHACCRTRLRLCELAGALVRPISTRLPANGCLPPGPCGGGDVEAVRRAFEGGFDPSFTDDDGDTHHPPGSARTAATRRLELPCPRFPGAPRSSSPGGGDGRKPSSPLPKMGEADELSQLLDAHLELDRRPAT